MINIIIIFLIFAVLWFTKKKWGAWIVSFFKGGSKGLITTEKTENSVIFQPQGTVRTFFIALNFEENGDGTVKMSIAKVKDKEL